MQPRLMSQCGMSHSNHMEITDPSATIPNGKYICNKTNELIPNVKKWNKPTAPNATKSINSAT